MEKIFADALAWSASIAVHRAAVPCETPGAWQLPLLFGALPSWERALEKEWSNPSFDHLQLRKTKEKEKKSFSRLPRFNPKLSAYGLRPIAHNKQKNKHRSIVHTSFSPSFLYLSLSLSQTCLFVKETDNS